MVTPLCFFWSKILPISYSNYLSETEILEAMRRKLDLVISELNRVEEYIEKELSGDIEKIANEQILIFYNTQILPQLNELKEDIENTKDALDTAIDQINNRLNEAIEELNKAVDEAVDSLNKKVEQALTEIKLLEENVQIYINSIRQQLLGLQEKIDFNRAWMEKSLSLAEARWLRMLNNQYEVIIRWCRKYFNELSEFTLTVRNPLTGKYDTLNNVLQSLYEFLNQGLTAYQYDILNLTALEYDSLGLTAFEYDNYGIHGFTGTAKDAYLLWDLLGREVEQPMSSVWTAFGHNLTASDDNYGLTTEQYDSVENEVTAFNVSKWGRYYLANHGKAVLKDTVHLYADTIAVTSWGISEITGILKLDEDNGLVPNHELLTDISVEHLVHDAKVEVVGWNDGLYSLSINRFELVEGGIAFNGFVNNGCRHVDAQSGEMMPATLLIDVSALTSTIDREVV